MVVPVVVVLAVGVLALVATVISRDVGAWTWSLFVLCGLVGAAVFVVGLAAKVIEIGVRSARDD